MSESTTWENSGLARRLAAALKAVLGKPEAGAMTYLRCLAPDAVRALIADPAFAVPGWTVWAVTDRSERSKRLITADEAVELREDKGAAAVLLVDRDGAGAGMDGIYSAVREVSEAELFEQAKKVAVKELVLVRKGSLGKFIQKAVTKARRVGRANSLSPWREFEFYSACADRPEAIGSFLWLIGLWPAHLPDEDAEEVLDQSVVMVERLLLLGRADETAEARVATLLLPENQREEADRLVQMLRKTIRLPWTATLELVGEYPDLWLNPLRPGLFDQRQLQRLELLPWRSAKSIYSWSGLAETDGRLHFTLNREPATPKDRSRLELRWRTEPNGLEKGSVDYRVEVVSGSDTLAEKTVLHTGKDPQKVALTLEDFEDLDENARFEARLRVVPVGRDDLAKFSEDFILDFGEVTGPTKSGAGSVVPSMVHALAKLEKAEDFAESCRLYSDTRVYGRDARGDLTFRFRNQQAKVAVPALLAKLGEDWAARGGEPGRWRVRVRSDGTAVGQPEFISCPPSVRRDAVWEKLVAASKALSERAKSGVGLAGLVHCSGEVAGEYINAWANALERGEPELALAHTIEVRSLGGQILGVVVLPSHPLRVAWQQSYDQLVEHARYKDGLRENALRALLSGLEGAHFPAFLPGFDGTGAFVFGDVLGGGAVAMVPEGDREPKTTIALLSQLVLGKSSGTAEMTAASEHALAQEVGRYRSLHPDYSRLLIHALRAGDGATVARALGEVVRKERLSEEEAEDGPKLGQDLSFYVQFHPGEARSEATGRFLSSLAERRRAGAGVVSEVDRWLLESVGRPGGVSVPRLSWAKRKNPEPEDPAHLSLSFDTFRYRVVAEPTTGLEGRPLEVYGLAAPMARSFDAEAEPRWRSYLAPTTDGEKHPAGRGLTDRLGKIHAALLRATAASVGGVGSEAASWPVLLTSFDREKQDSIRRLHDLSDWVVTVDRNVGIEYFDAPNDRPEVYQAYVIDCVPERQDLNYLQLVTSTGRLEEVVNLLDLTLADLGLSASPRNCQFLLDELKGLSGRFAMRLSGNGSQSQELIALALTHHQCAAMTAANGPWLPLTDGFFVPLDELPDLGLKKSGSANGPATVSVGEGQDGSRADLVYVSCPKKGGLRFAFVEVKYRRYLKTARAFDLLDRARHQIAASRRRWTDLYKDDDSGLEKAVRRAHLARLLRFYALKGSRHHLNKEAFGRIMRELDRLVRDGKNYLLSEALEDTSLDRGFIFCPEYASREPSALSAGGQTPLFLFGPSALPDGSASTNRPTSSQLEVLDEPLKSERTPSRTEGQESAVSIAEVLTADTVGDFEDLGEVVEAPEVQLPPNSPVQPPISGASVVLGRTSMGIPAMWRVAINANPHLLMVGLPGMGKTTSLINICVQLVTAGITPIVFSYHEDIDAQLEIALPGQLSSLDYNGLGFNPLRVTDARPTAFVDNVSTLRDVFAAIFPDLGDIQLGRIREALKQSYVDLGWSGESESGRLLPTPDFQTFYDLLKSQPKPDGGILTRFAELDDYGFFRGTSGGKNLLEASSPTILRIHGTQNEVLQRAFAIFVLHNLYKGMFERGVTNRITHAVVFDEAHRAAKLKLIATMAKECRKYGISLIIASQETKDFDTSIYNAIANYLCLRLNESDARVMAKIITNADEVKRVADQIKAMPKHNGFFFGEGQSRPARVALGRWEDIQDLSEQ